MRGRRRASGQRVHRRRRRRRRLVVVVRLLMVRIDVRRVILEVVVRMARSAGRVVVVQVGAVGRGVCAGAAVAHDALDAALQVGERGRGRRSHPHSQSGVHQAVSRSQHVHYCPIKSPTANLNLLEQLKSVDFLLPLSSSSSSLDTDRGGLLKGPHERTRRPRKEEEEKEG